MSPRARTAIITLSSSASKLREPGVPERVWEPWSSDREGGDTGNEASLAVVIGGLKVLGDGLQRALSEMRWWTEGAEGDRWGDGAMLSRPLEVLVNLLACVFSSMIGLGKHLHIRTTHLNPSLLFYSPSRDLLLLE